MTASPLPVRIVATGGYLPGPAVLSEEIDRRLGLSLGTTERELGIRSRHFAGTMPSSEMAALASSQALESAGWLASDLDLIVSACAVMEQPIPTQAVLLQKRLGLAEQGVPVLDVNATCLSFLAAIDTVSYAMAAGRYRRVLVVSSEIASRGLDWSKLEICGNFGDGAAAVLLERTDNTQSAILGARFETWSNGAQYCELRSGGTLLNMQTDAEAFQAGAIFRMNGDAAYRITARHFPRFMKALLETADCHIDSLDVIVPHQASAGALDHLRRLVKLPRDKVIDIFAGHGNQIAVSLPMALHRAFEQGRLERGQTVLLLGTSAGISLGGMVVRL